MAAELRKQAKATRCNFEGEDNPVGEDEDEDEYNKDNEDEEKDEEEEEDPGYYDSGDDEEDDDSLSASSHRPITRSTPKKKLVSRPKRKAYRT